MNRIIFVLLFLVSTAGLSQLNGDSLLQVWNDEKADIAERLQAGGTFFEGYVFVKPDTARIIANEVIQLAGSDERNLEFIGRAYSSIGISYYLEGDLPLSLDNYFSALKIFTTIKDSVRMKDVNQMIAITYYRIEDWEQCLKYNNVCLEFARNNKDSMSESAILDNIGLVYAEQDQHEVAIEYYQNALLLLALPETEIGAINIYHNMAVSYEKSGDFKEAEKYYQVALKMNLEFENMYGLIASYAEYGSFLARYGDAGKAIELCSKGLEISLASNQRPSVKGCYQCLSIAYEKKGKYDTALDYLNKYVDLNDSLATDDMKSEIIQKEALFQYDRQKFADSLEFAKNAELKELSYQRSMDQEKSTKYLLIMGLGIVVVLLILITQRMKIVRKKNKEIEHQKNLVEEKNDEIMDSLAYAKRIQAAILPPEDYIHKHLPESFVLYIPKDVVSGDFYWMETFAPPEVGASVSKGNSADEVGASVSKGNSASEVGASASKGNVVLFGAADCTGHGVPGAMVSVVCNNALNRSVREYNLIRPAEILDKTRELVIETFSKSDKEVRDGMDFSLCAFMFHERKVIFCGANNPLWIIRKNDNLSSEQLNDTTVFKGENFSLLELKGNKQPIGLYAGMKKYEDAEETIYPGDIFYLFTDGFADQFGGTKGKKFMYKQLKQLILSVSSLPMHEQKAKLANAFAAWRGVSDQTDDVCIAGIRIS